MTQMMGVALAVLLGAAPIAFAAEPADEVSQAPNFGLEPNENDVAVIIGISKYRDAPSSEFSDDDAKLMKDYLVSLGFRESKIQLLLNDRATRADFSKSIERWLPNNVQPTSRVFFYYSGHGAPDATQPDKPAAYLLPYDGDPSDLANTGYARDTLVAHLGKLKAAQVMVMLDSCFSGTGPRSVLPRGARPLMSQIVPVGALPRNMAILTASQASQISTSDPKRGHGVLTYHFLKAIREGQTGFGAIYKKIKPLVEDSAKVLNVVQTPSLLFGDATAFDRFQLVDPAAMKAARDKREAEALAKKEAEEKARKERESDATVQAERKRLEEEKKRHAEEQMLAQQKLKETQDRYEREAKQREAEAKRREYEAQQREAQRDAERQRELEAERERIRRQGGGGGGQPVFVPPSF